jgi:hypothetical protein
VKNTDTVRKEFITDLGFQRLILRKSGVPLSSSFLILRGEDIEETNENLSQIENNPENAKRGGHVCVEYIKYDGFTYKIVDVTQAAKRMEFVASKEIFEQFKEMPLSAMQTESRSDLQQVTERLLDMF